MKKQKEKYRYVFPSIMAKMMKDVPMRIQLEGSLLSMFLIMISLTLMVIYLLFFGEGSIAYKIILFMNLICGFLYISSSLVTAYQQYINHMEAMGYDPEKEKEEVLKRGRLLKRIICFMKERKKIKKLEKEIKKPLLPSFVEDSLNSMEKFDMKDNLNSNYMDERR